MALPRPDELKHIFHRPYIPRASNAAIYYTGYNWANSRGYDLNF